MPVDAEATSHIALRGKGVYWARLLLLNGRLWGQGVAVASSTALAAPETALEHHCTQGCCVCACV